MFYQIPTYPSHPVPVKGVGDGGKLRSPCEVHSSETTITLKYWDLIMGLQNTLPHPLLTIPLLRVFLRNFFLTSAHPTLKEKSQSILNSKKVWREKANIKSIPKYGKKCWNYQNQTSTNPSRWFWCTLKFDNHWSTGLIWIVNFLYVISLFFWGGVNSLTILLNISFK